MLGMTDRSAKLEADDGLELGDEIRVAAALEGAQAVRLQPVGGPDLLHRKRRLWTCPLGVEGWDQNVMRL